MANVINKIKKGADEYDIQDPNAATKTELQALETTVSGKQDALTETQLAAVNSGIDSTKVGQIATNASDIDTIEGKIPAQASSSNQLADKDFVNSSVATNTANYISDNGQPFTSLEALEAYSGTLSNNDYAFVVGTDQAGNTTYTRYKYVADQEEWAEEYVLNNSSFTANQWASINSGITSGDVSKLAGIEAGAEVNEIDSISVNGTAVTPDANKNVDLMIDAGIKTLTTADYNYPATGTKTALSLITIESGVYIAGENLNIIQPDGTERNVYKNAILIVTGDNDGGHRQVLYSTGTRNNAWRIVDSTGIKAQLETIDNLTSTSTTSPLSAAQGKYLNDNKADKTAFTGTDGTSAGTMGLVPAPATTDAGKVLGADGSWTGLPDGIKTLTAADYNYPTTGTKTTVALWLLPTGVYMIGEQMSISMRLNVSEGASAGDLFIVQKENNGNSRVLRSSGGSGRPWRMANISNGTMVYGTGSGAGVLGTPDIADNLTQTVAGKVLDAKQGKVLKDLIDSLVVKQAGAPTTSTTGTVGAILEDTVNGDLYQLKSIDTSVSPNTYNWEKVGGGGGAVFTELTSADFNYPTNNPDRIASWMLPVGFYTFTNDTVNQANIMATTSNYAGSVAVGAKQSFAVLNASSGSEAVRTVFFGGATGGYPITAYIASVADGSPVGGNTQRYGKILTLNDVQTATGTGDYPMSQNAVTGMVYNDPSSRRRVQLGYGASANSNDSVSIGRWSTASASAAVAIGGNTSNNATMGCKATAEGAVAIGIHANASGIGSLALGASSSATAQGEINIGTSSTGFGYNSSNYRLLTGLYDPQSDHDAATKGYVDNAVASAGADTFTTNEWDALWA